nr:MAG TPA: hypothetical protein [Caudoviricetes sp.]
MADCFSAVILKDIFSILRSIFQQNKDRKKYPANKFITLITKYITLIRLLFRDVVSFQFCCCINTQKQ